MKLSENILPTTNSEEYKKVHSCYHLAAIILAAKYVPYETKFLSHLVSSFEKNYRINLMENLEDIDLTQKEPEANLFMDFIEIDTKVEKIVKKSVSSKKSPKNQILKTLSKESKIEESTNVGSINSKKPKFPLLTSKIKMKSSKKNI